MPIYGYYNRFHMNKYIAAPFIQTNTHHISFYKQHLHEFVNKALSNHVKYYVSLHSLEQNM